MFKSSIIIPTYNRFRELQDCIHSIINQTVKPYELIIVDDGNLSEPPLEKECKAAGIRYIYHKKDTPGLTESRNAGIKLANGNIIFFLDDDVVLFPDYIEEILKVYEADKTNTVGGVGGAIANCKPLNLGQRTKRMIDVLFLLSGFREGKVLPSGYCTSFGTTNFPIKKIQEVDFLSGGVMSYRMEIFQEFSFTDKYRNYGYGEDKDFSFRVSKKYKLFFNPKAKILHLESPKMRPDEVIAGRKLVIGRYLFFRDLVKKSRVEWLLFYYALFGYILGRIIILIFYPNKNNLDRLRGIFIAVRDILKGNILIN